MYIENNMKSEIQRRRWEWCEEVQNLTIPTEAYHNDFVFIVYKFGCYEMIIR